MAFHHCVHGKSLFVVVFVGPCPVCCSALLLCWMAKRISGWGICFSPFVVFLFVVVCAVDLSHYITTGVNVDVFLTASSHVRTEPPSVIGRTRGKKKAIPCHEPNANIPVPVH